MTEISVKFSVFSLTIFSRECNIIFTLSLTSHINNLGALKHIYFRNYLGVRLLEHVQ